MGTTPPDRWVTGGPYERYIGRWSRRVAPAFFDWLAVPTHHVWVDVGCGTGALAAGILGQYEPRTVIAIDRSEGFLGEARRSLPHPHVQFLAGNAMHLPLAGATCEVAVSALVLNFVPEPATMAREMARVTKPGGTVAAYVWDYARGMEMLRHFWDAATAVSAEAALLDEGERFPLCQPDALRALWQDVGLTAISVRAIDIQTVFRDFEDYWTPFLGKQGPAPTYLASLDLERQERIRALLQARLRPAADGTIALTARAWAVQGRVAFHGG